MKGEFDHEMKMAEKDTLTTARAIAKYGRPATRPGRRPFYVTAAATQGGGGCIGGAIPGGGIRDRRRRNTTNNATAIATMTMAPMMSRTSPRVPAWYRYAV